MKKQKKLYKILEEEFGSDIREYREKWETLHNRYE